MPAEPTSAEKVDRFGFGRQHSDAADPRRLLDVPSCSGDGDEHDPKAG
jgi:hypothetical protein